MKKITIFLSMCLLLNSCFTYKKVDLNEVGFNEKDIFKITKVDKNVKKGRLHSLNDSLIVLQRKAGELHIISMTDIQEIQKRKFSLGKTIALPVGITAAFVAVVISAFSNWSVSLGELNYY